MQNPLHCSSLKWDLLQFCSRQGALTVRAAFRNLEAKVAELDKQRTKSEQRFGGEKRRVPLPCPQLFCCRGEGRSPEGRSSVPERGGYPTGRDPLLEGSPSSQTEDAPPREGGGRFDNEDYRTEGFRPAGWPPGAKLVDIVVVHVGLAPTTWGKCRPAVLEEPFRLLDGAVK